MRGCSGGGAESKHGAIPLTNKNYVFMKKRHFLLSLIVLGLLITCKPMDDMFELLPSDNLNELNEQGRVFMTLLQAQPGWEQGVQQLRSAGTPLFNEVVSLGILPSKDIFYVLPIVSGNEIVRIVFYPLIIQENERGERQIELDAPKIFDEQAMKTDSLAHTFIRFGMDGIWRERGYSLSFELTFENHLYEECCGYPQHQSSRQYYSDIADTPSTRSLTNGVWHEFRVWVLRRLMANDIFFWDQLQRDILAKKRDILKHPDFNNPPEFEMVLHHRVIGITEWRLLTRRAGFPSGCLQAYCQWASGFFSSLQARLNGLPIGCPRVLDARVYRIFCVPQFIQLPSPPPPPPPPPPSPPPSGIGEIARQFLRGDLTDEEWKKVEQKLENMIKNPLGYALINDILSHMALDGWDHLHISFIDGQLSFFRPSLHRIDISRHRGGNVCLLHELFHATQFMSLSNPADWAAGLMNWEIEARIAEYIFLTQGDHFWSANLNEFSILQGCALWDIVERLAAYIDSQGRIIYGKEGYVDRLLIEADSVFRQRASYRNFPPINRQPAGGLFPTLRRLLGRFL